MPAPPTLPTIDAPVMAPPLSGTCAHVSGGIVQYAAAAHVFVSVKQKSP